MFIAKEKERFQRTADVDGVETDGSDPNENFVFPYFRDRGFLENDVFFLKVLFEESDPN